MSELPFIDEHSLAVDAPREAAWEALLATVPAGFEPKASEAVARLLGCRPARSTGLRPLEVGSTFPGFAVTEAQRPARLTLAGRHRFSISRLEFAIEETGSGRSRVRAGTWAAFPGPHGRAYRAAVIGTRGHVVVVRRMLSAVARRARTV
ncbi:hypothetical protein BH20ACT19_BH20ACT19_09170 [soil metagenome]